LTCLTLRVRSSPTLHPDSYRTAIRGPVPGMAGGLDKAGAVVVRYTIYLKREV